MKKALKFIMVLLVGVFVLRILVITAVALPAIFTDPQKALGGLTGVKNASWESSLRFGSLRLTRSFGVDSMGRATGPVAFIGTEDMKADMFFNERPVVETPKGDILEARFVSGNKGLLVPVSYSYFRVMAILIAAIMILLSVWMAYVAVQLYRFAKASEAGHFFTDANRKRLRSVGIFLLLTGLLYLLFDLCFPWVISATSGLRGFSHKLNPDSLPLFPYALVMGLLMFIMAEAFNKGEVLKSENDLTI